MVIHQGITAIGDNAFKEMDFRSVSIPSSVKTIGDFAFYGSGIKKVILSKGLKTIGKEAFCFNSPTSLKIPSTVRTIKSGAFWGCMDLKKLTLSNGIKKIEDYAFFDVGISSVTIPSSVTYIGDNAFGICTSLRTVYIKGKKTKIYKTAFTGLYKNNPTNAQLVVYGYKGSTAQKFAIKYKMGFRTYGVKTPARTKITTLSKNKSRAKTILKFKKVSGAYQYEIQLSTSDRFDAVVMQAFSTNTKIVMKGIDSSYVGKTVYVRVRAYKKTKGKISVSNWSKVKKTMMKE